MSITERLAELVAKSGKSVRAFALSANVPPKSMDNYLRGTMPPADVLESICSKTGASPEWLLMGRGSMFLSPAQERLPCADVIPLGRDAASFYHAAKGLQDLELASALRRTVRVFLSAEEPYRSRALMALEMADPGEKKTGLGESDDSARLGGPRRGGRE